MPRIPVRSTLHRTPRCLTTCCDDHHKKGAARPQQRTRGNPEHRRDRAIDTIHSGAFLADRATTVYRQNAVHFCLGEVAVLSRKNVFENFRELRVRKTVMHTGAGIDSDEAVRDKTAEEAEEACDARLRHSR